jgi:hypothetical protein
MNPGFASNIFKFKIFTVISNKPPPLKYALLHAFCRGRIFVEMVEELEKLYQFLSIY